MSASSASSFSFGRCALCSDDLREPPWSLPISTGAFVCPDCFAWYRAVTALRLGIAREQERERERERERAARCAALPAFPELPGCERIPDPGKTYCAAAWLAFSERERESFVPEGVAVLCSAHAMALAEYIERHCVERGDTPTVLLGKLAALEMQVIVATEAMVARVAARSGRQ